MIVKPLLDRVIVKPLPPQVSEHGVYIPQSSAERSILMTVVALGEINTAEFAIGDKVLVSKYAGVEVVVDNEKHYIMKCHDVLAKFES